MVCAGLIFVLSSLSPSQVKLRLLSLAGADKLLHVAAYLGLGLALSRGLHPAGGAFRWPHALAAIVLVSLYGISDELHQYYAGLGRIPDVWDGVADATGATLAALLWPWLARLCPVVRADRAPGRTTASLSKETTK